MKSLKKLTAIVLAMLMVMTMGVFSSSAVCYDTDGTTVIDCVDAETPADDLCDTCGEAEADCTCADGFVDEATPADGVCDVCGDTIEDDSTDPFDFLNSIVEAIEGFIAQIVDFIEGLVESMRSLGDTY